MSNEANESSPNVDIESNVVQLIAAKTQITPIENPSSNNRALAAERRNMEMDSET